MLFPERARADTHVEANLNHPFPAQVALAATLHAASLRRAALADVARRAGAQIALWLAALDAYCARVLPTKFYDGHLFRFFWGLGIALTANFWLTELAAKREKPDDKGDV